MRLLGAVALLTLVGCADSGVGPKVDAAPDTLPTPMAGGAMTIQDSSSLAYSRPPPGLTGDRFQLHLDGRAGFAARFTADSTESDPGLGPAFNQDSCEGCHLRRGRSPGSVLLRLSSAGSDAHGGPAEVEGFGVQLQDRAIRGFVPEGTLAVQYDEVPGSYPDGTGYSLRRPRATVDRPYRALDGAMQGLRAPRPIFGLGLLEAVSAADLEARADPADADGDGISGRVNRVWDVGAGTTAVGRFGWKANEPSILQQVARAYLEDMGVTSRVFSQEAFRGQTGQDDGRSDDPELPDDRLDAVTFFVQTLGVPVRRGVNDPEVRTGEALFTSLGCAACHLPTLVTGTSGAVPEVENQTIHPYTDLLLHDMGPELADGRPDFSATGQEWRTPPLWGLGLAATVQGQTEFLHDGRARSPEEAVLWHGGEAEAARTRFRALTADARKALLSFLASL